MEIAENMTVVTGAADANPESVAQSRRAMDDLVQVAERLTAVVATFRC